MSNNFLPRPSINFFPRLMARDPDAGTLALAAKLDALMGRWETSQLDIAKLLSPESCPARWLDWLGDYVNAGIFPYDTDRQKRVKIATAIQAHKRRGSWELDAKPKIDAITGTDTELVTNVDESGQWVMIGDNTTPSTVLWGSMGLDNPPQDPPLGLKLLGNGDELEIKGNVYIDLKLGPTSYSLRDTGPAGGLIFHIDSLNGIYYEAAPASGEIQKVWYDNFLGLLVGVPGTAIGDGVSNTEKIVQAFSGDLAAQYCDGLTLGGYSDWFLPSFDELQAMYDELKLYSVGGFGTGTYWSSSEYSSTPDLKSYGIWFGGGTSNGYIKTSNYYVRPARAFEMSYSPDKIQRIRELLEFDIVPAYYRIFLGYFVGTVFIVYPNGIIE